MSASVMLASAPGLSGVPRRVSALSRACSAANSARLNDRSPARASALTDDRATAPPGLRRRREKLSERSTDHLQSYERTRTECLIASNISNQRTRN
jgi:hypothetical protein